MKVAHVYIKLSIDYYDTQASLDGKHFSYLCFHSQCGKRITANTTTSTYQVTNKDSWTLNGRFMLLNLNFTVFS